MHHYIDVAALLKVLLASLVAGVGLVSLFGVGLVGVSEHRGQMQAGVHAGRRGGAPWLVLASAAFAVVVAGIVLGVRTIVT